jgi:hypothetical protein
LGVAIPFAFVGWPVPLAKLGTGGSFATVCVFGWIIGQDGAARPGSVVGAVATLGVLLLEPLLVRVVRVRHRRGRIETRNMVFARVGVAQLVCALIAARWAGMAHDADVALMRLIIFLPVAISLTLWVQPRVPRRRAGARSR